MCGFLRFILQSFSLIVLHYLLSASSGSLLFILHCLPSLYARLGRTERWYTRFDIKVKPLLAGFFIPDVIVAATIGVITGWCVGPLTPVLGHWLARSAIIKFLLQLTVLSMALSSQFFPYSFDAPKRVGLQHTILTAGI